MTLGITVPKGGPYRPLVVESFELLSTSGHRDPVQIRPAPGQPYPSSMLLECSRRMVDSSVYPVGTMFLAWVRVKQKSGCRPHLYCYHGDEIVTLKPAEARRRIAQMRKGNV